eukprot:TRINITY_DN16834_c0_g1_i1.p1 TRINITY_DN16834_c0_g1~~TRINITY_DN16834_c0_g1_i1.p1  ORF type:complete len:1230 (+),score=214.83 TRINITY_DN16834_c0_g1_i1:63-3752(+)
MPPLGGCGQGQGESPATARRPVTAALAASLPRVPHHGPRSRCGPTVLLSRIQEVTSAASRPRPAISRLPVVGTSADCSLSSQLRTALFHSDQIVKPRLFDAVLAAEVEPRARSTNASAFAGSSEEWMANPAWDAVFGSTSDLHSEKGAPEVNASTVDLAPVASMRTLTSNSGSEVRSARRMPQHSATASTMLQTRRFTFSGGAQEGPSPLDLEKAERSASLRASMRHSQEEVEARLQALEARSAPGGGPLMTFDRQFSDKTAPSSPRRGPAISDFGAESLYESKSSISWSGGETSDSDSARGDESDAKTAPDLDELLAAYKRSTIRMLPARALEKVQGSAYQDGNGMIGLMASMEEIELAFATANFYRWLCGLEPLQDETACSQAASMMAKVLTPRAPSGIDVASRQSRSVEEFGKLLGAFITHERCAYKVVAMHQETSLITCVEQSVTSDHMTDNVGSAGASKLHDTMSFTSALYEDILDRGLPCAHAASQAHGARRPETYGEIVVGPGDKWWQPEAPVVVAPEFTLSDLPKPLQCLRLFWALIPPQRPKESRAQARRAFLKKTCIVVPGFDGQVKSARGHSRGAGARIREQEAPAADDAAAMPRGRSKVASDACQGDREGRVSFRALLLDPCAKEFGAARAQDTCVLWIGMGRHHRRQGGLLFGGEGGAAAAALEAPRSHEPAEPDPGSNRPPCSECVVFPAPGIFPHEMLMGRVPIWTIMPDRRFYQPTHTLRIRMWMVSIDMAAVEAERLQEVPIDWIRCDCSSPGKPFCILFRPALDKIVPGQQFEVEISHLRGPREQHRFFHDFRALRPGRAEGSLIAGSNILRSLVSKRELWEPVKARAASSGKIQQIQGPQGAPEADGGSLPEIGLVTHPNVHIQTHKPEVCLGLVCSGIASMRAELHGTVISGDMKKAALVLRYGDRFVVNVKLPCAPTTYVLYFFVSLPESPHKMVPHQLKYIIEAVEGCQSYLQSIEHPLAKKFGYFLQTPIAQCFGVTVAAPLMYKVRAKTVYFAMCFDPENEFYLAETQREARTGPTRLFSTRLASSSEAAPDPSGAPAADPSPVGTGRRSKQRKAKVVKPVASERSQSSASAAAARSTTMESSKRVKSKQANLNGEACVVRAMQEALGPKLSRVVQDARDAWHVDLSLITPGPSSIQRYGIRLRQRAGFSNLYEGFLHLRDRDVGCRVEMYIRAPRSGAARAQCTPLKIGEWLVVDDSEVCHEHP